MAQSKGYLAIDLGAESVRAIVGVLEFGTVKKLQLHEIHRFRHEAKTVDGLLTWDWTLIWGNILEGARQAVAWAKREGVPLVSLGVDAWGVDCAYVDRDGELLRHPLCYRDPRNVPAYEELLSKAGRENVYAQTGIQFMPINTLPQVYAMHRADPEFLAGAYKLLFIPDLLHHGFCGSMVVESSIASTSQMVNPHTGGWARDLLDTLGLPTHFLPEIVPAGTDLGPVLPRVAADIGADENLRVITPAGHDTGSAIAAVPADMSTNWCYLSSGTWSLIGAELPESCTSDAAREVPFTNEGGLEGTTRFLKNITGLWMVQECRRAFEKQGVDEGGARRHIGYDEITAAAEAAEPFRTLLDTDHAPFLQPGDMPAKIAAFARETNQPEPGGLGATVRCCLESLALTYRHVLGKLESVLDRRFDVLHILGGGGKNRLLNQMTADAIGRKVIVGPEEATAAGNVLVQAMGSGDVKDLQEIRNVVAESFETTVYEPANTAAWDAAYARFTGLLGR